MDGDGTLTPTQTRVLSDLMGLGQARPTFDRDLALGLRDDMETALADLADALGDQQLGVTKRALSQVHACERHAMAEEAVPFEWSVTTAVGAVAHKAIELSATLRTAPPPEHLVDVALDRLSADLDRGPGRWLAGADPVDVAELRGAALDRVLKFADEFPPVKLSWRPRLESSLSTSLCADRIWLRGKVDLALGRPTGTTAGVLIVDFKTGRPGRACADDLRFYALLETLRTGVPPFRVASWYLDSGRFHAEDVTEDLLAGAARRAVDGARALYELRLDGRSPRILPGPTCGYCRERATCDGAVTWATRREALGLDA